MLVYRRIYRAAVVEVLTRPAFASGQAPVTAAFTCRKNGESTSYHATDLFASHECFRLLSMRSSGNRWPKSWVTYMVLPFSHYSEACHVVFADSAGSRDAVASASTYPAPRRRFRHRPHFRQRDPDGDRCPWPASQEAQFPRQTDARVAAVQPSRMRGCGLHSLIPRRLEAEPVQLGLVPDSPAPATCARHLYRNLWGVGGSRTAEWKSSAGRRHR